MSKLTGLSEWRYVAMFETGQKGKNYFKFAYIYAKPGDIVQPIIHIQNGEYVYAPTQEHIARVFKISQQSVSRWMKNKEPEL